MKKIVLFLMTAISSMILLLCTYAYSETADVYMKMQIGNPFMTINGIAVEIDEGRGTSPVIVNGRTLIPVRAVTEALGGSVIWDSATSSAILTVGNDTVILTVGSNISYLNGKKTELDVGPEIIGDRTMIPIRFIAESFGFGVAWDEFDKSIYIVRDVLSISEYNKIAEMVPDYDGNAYAVINENVPYFKDYEIIPVAFEYYGNLDELGRCTVASASVDEDIMPIEERGSISHIEPSGWMSVSYDFVSGKYLYNRCHLIGYQLSGENANRRNLITGTRYLNMDGMIKFENMVSRYVEETDNRVMYRVTPVFKEKCLVADGVLIEAYSIEDSGSSLSLCVYCYNVQPGVVIDYESGESRVAESGEDIYIGLELITLSYTGKTEVKTIEIYRTPTGKRYHYDKSCGGVNSYGISYEKAMEDLLTPCKKCADVKTSEGNEPSDVLL